jgi:hypothetical protein
LTSILPVKGLTTGGTQVTVTGANLQEASELKIGPCPVQGYSVSGDGSQATGLTSECDRGTYDLSVTTPGGTASLASAYKYLKPATITSLDPPSITADQPATTVIIRGAGLVPPVTVTVGQGGAAFDVVAAPGTESAVPVQVPALLEGSYPVSLVNGDEQGADSPSPLEVEAPPGPAIQSVTPNRGPESGGNDVRLAGRNFGGATEVLFGVAPARNLRVAGNGRDLQVEAPANARGTVHVKVTTPAGASTLNNGYTYVRPVVISGLSPSVAPAMAISTVVASGTGMVAPHRVVLSDGTTTTEAGVTGETDTSVTFQVPPLPAHDYTVTVINGDNESGVSPVALEVREGLTVTAVYPRFGFVDETTPVEIVGTGLAGVTSVEVGGVPCGSLQGVTSQRVTCTVPTGSVGTVEVVVRRGSVAQGVVPGGFTYVSASDTTVRVMGVTPGLGRTTAGSTVDVAMTGMGGNTPTVTFGNSAATGATLVGGRRVRVNLPSRALASGMLSERVNVSATVSGTTDTCQGCFLYYVRPTVTAVSPQAGATVGGDVVTVTGTGFTAEAMRVRFDGVEATEVRTVTAIQATCRAPGHAAAWVPVAVQNEFESSEPLANAYNFVEAVRMTGLEPNAGSIAGGTRVEITGSGFVANRMRLTVVEDGTQATNYTVVSPTILRVNVPARANAGRVTLRLVDTGREGQPFSSGDHGFDYRDGTIAGGGTAGPTIERNVTVTVLRQDNGQRLAGAAVFLGSAWGTAQASTRAQTNANGMAVLWSDTLAGRVTITAALSGYENQTLVEVDASDVTFSLTKQVPDATPTPTMAQVTGTVLNWQEASYPAGADQNRYKRFAVIYPSDPEMGVLAVNPGSQNIVGETAGCDVTMDGVYNPPPSSFLLRVPANTVMGLVAVVYFYDAQADGICGNDLSDINNMEGYFPQGGAAMGLRGSITVGNGVNPGNDIPISMPVDYQAVANFTNAPIFQGGTTVRALDAMIDTGNGSVITFVSTLSTEGTLAVRNLLPQDTVYFLPPSLSFPLSRIPTGIPQLNARFPVTYRAVSAAPSYSGGTIVGSTLPASYVYKRGVSQVVESMEGWYPFPAGMTPGSFGNLANRQFSWTSFGRSGSAIIVDVGKKISGVWRSAWSVLVPPTATGFQLPSLLGAPTGDDLNVSTNYRWQLQAVTVYDTDGWTYDVHTNDLLGQRHIQARVVSPAYDFNP